MELGPGPLLADRVAVVTGGGAGIGRGIVELFARHGAIVVVADIDPELVAGLPDGVAGHVCDVRDVDQLDAFVAETLERHGAPQVLVNNVGHYLFRGVPFAETTEAEWHELYRTNLEHVFRATHRFLPAMIAAGRGGSIVNLSTVEGVRGVPGQPVYSAFKAGVSAFTRSLALQVSEHGIRINDIAPDVTETPQLPYGAWLDDTEYARADRWVPLGRFGTPADHAGVALFLASDLSGFVTGATIPVDGGTLVAGGWYRTDKDGRTWTNRPFDA
jgi:NAD(P)-dependent dehydrogenase (short-subunit alcohol dehydrogenase family)